MYGCTDTGMHRIGFLPDQFPALYSAQSLSEREQHSLDDTFLSAGEFSSPRLTDRSVQIITADYERHLCNSGGWHGLRHTGLGAPGLLTALRRSRRHHWTKT